jgi:hypothetical protein
MKLNDFPRAGPHTLPAISAPFIDDRNPRFQKLNCIFRTNSDTAPAKIAFAGHNVDHQRRITLHISRLEGGKYRTVGQGRERSEENQ